MKISKTFIKDNDTYDIDLILTIRSTNSRIHVHLDIFRNGHFIDFQPESDELDTYEEYHKLYMEKLTEVIPYEWIREMKEELLTNLKLQINSVI